MKKLLSYLCSLCLYITSFSIIPTPAFADTESDMKEACSRAANEKDPVRKRGMQASCDRLKAQMASEQKPTPTTSQPATEESTKVAKTEGEGEAEKQLSPEEKYRDEQCKLAEEAETQADKAYYQKRCDEAEKKLSAGDLNQKVADRNKACYLAEASTDQIDKAKHTQDCHKLSDELEEAGLKPQLEDFGSGGSGVSAAEATMNTALGIQSVTMILAVFFGIFYIPIQCSSAASGKFTADAWVFFAGSIAYALAEFAAWGYYKKASDTELKIYKDQDYDKQRAAFIRAEKQTKSAAKAVKMRAVTTLATSTVWYASAIVAVFMGLAASQSGQPANADRCVYTAENLKPELPSEMKTYYAKIDHIRKNSSSRFQLFKNILNFIIPELHAAGALQDQLKSFLMGLGISAAIILTFIILMLTSLNPVISKAIASGFSRAVIWGVFAVLATVVYSMLNSAAKKLEARAKEYADLGKKLEEMKYGKSQYNPEQQKSGLSGTPEELGFGRGNDGSGNPYAMASYEQSKCIKGTGENVILIDCKYCKNPAHCRVANIPSIQSNPFLDFPPTAANVTAKSSQYANAWSSGNTSESKRLGGQLAGENLAVAGLFKRILSSANKALAKNGKQPVDFEALKKEGRGGFFQGVLNAWNKLTGAQKNEVKTELNKRSFSSEEGDNAPKDPGLAKAMPEKQKATKVVKAAKDWHDEGLASQAASLSDQEKNEESKFKSSDIHHDEDKSLFQIIHNRYIKSLPVLGE